MVFGVGVLSQLMLGVPSPMPAVYLASVVVPAVPLAVPAVPLAVPVSGVADGLLVPDGVALGVAVAVLLGVGVGLPDTLAVGVGVPLGVGVAMQVGWGSGEMSGLFALRPAGGRLGLTPLWPSPGVAVPVTPGRAGW